MARTVGTRGDQDFDCLLGIIGEGNCGGAEHQHDKDHCDEDLEIFHGYAPSEKYFNDLFRSIDHNNHITYNI